ncbi:hypothetical protein FNV43_RR16565 [Rhamnella rubrinervis]|uniref:Cation efflux protein transmembrane domain-containing protein n=1 Tax=Rhamnella rubrinervis TaxID=2594499 RepID=A0A8K0GZ12_9ROSA|nr:hypothetical protein FNV43_RR16565 [Rhamnella rubrinervis]
MEKSSSFNYGAASEKEFPNSWKGDFGLGAGDRRLAFSRQASFQQPHEPHTPIAVDLNESAKPFLSRSVSSIDIPPELYSEEENVKFFGVRQASAQKLSALLFVVSVFRIIRSGNKYMKRLFVLISLNVAYSTAELFIGLLTGRVGLVSDAFHLTFGCGLLTFSLFAMVVSREKPDGIYTFGYKRLEVLAAFTNALFLLFMSFSLAVEALHAFIEDESEHKHYLIVSAVTNLLVNLIGVWFFRNYARINLVYRKAEDMNSHSVCLHVLSDSIRSAGLILASWLLSLGYSFMLVMPLFRATGGILLQMSPPRIPPSALSKCWRQITAREDVSEVSQARFWELVPGHVVGSLSLQVKKGMDDRSIFQFVHGLYHELGIQDLTVQVDDA